MNGKLLQWALGIGAAAIIGGTGALITTLQRVAVLESKVETLERDLKELRDRAERHYEREGRRGTPQ